MHPGAGLDPINRRWIVVYCAESGSNKAAKPHPGSSDIPQLPVEELVNSNVVQVSVSLT